MSLSSLLLAPFAKRFVAGTRADQAIEAARRVNAQGLQAILDFLGEDILSEKDTEAAVEEYETLLEKIANAQVNAVISVKASQMGALISPELCLKNLTRVAKKAQQAKSFVWMDMEGSALTQRTLAAFEALRAKYPNVGLCLQAYLVRTGGDIDRLAKSPLRVRLCKGAYKEPPEIAFTSKRAVDGNFRILAGKLLDLTARNVAPAIATHDPTLIADIKKMAEQRHVPPSRVEFQMLYGIQNKRLVQLAQEGYPSAVYIPYGRAWLPYFLRRLRERRENWLFLLKNLHTS